MYQSLAKREPPVCCRNEPRVEKKVRKANNKMYRKVSTKRATLLMAALINLEIIHQI